MWTGADSQEEALRVSERARRDLGREASDRSVEPSAKITGFVVAFRIELEGRAWNDPVVGVIALGQRVGYQWTLGGDILSDTSGWSNESSVSGVRSIRWMPDRGWAVLGIAGA